jgi:phosphatidylserine/phosphatidylglycerophosphate/cardiolipin synthase-like enzyme
MPNGPDEPRFKPATPLVDRTLFLQTGGEVNTVEVPGDPQKQEFDRWYGTGGTPPMRNPTAGNLVKYMIGGDATFREMLDAMRTAKQPGHFVYLLGWFLGLDFPLISADESTTIIKIFRDLDSKGVQIRAMLWEQFLPAGPKATFDKVLGDFGRTKIFGYFNLPSSMLFANTDAVKFINTLPGKLSSPSIGPTAGAITDDRHPLFGAHHQKLLAVGGENGLVAFCGGCDINPDRIFGAGIRGSFAPGAPLHDVHCRVQGPAADDLLSVFVERWDSHPATRAIDQARGGLLPAPPVGQSIKGGQFVQVAETYGKGGKPFPLPRNTISRMIAKAIGAATEFIYIEDQYLVNLDTAQLLAARIPTLKHVTILIPAASLTVDLPECASRRQLFINVIQGADSTGKKIRVRQLKSPGIFNTYVHSKTWIFDDRFAIVGSPNVNKRGWENDSEVAIGILDTSTDEEVAHHLAHQLRIDLWAKHLTMDNPPGKAQLEHGVHSVGFWDTPPLGARIEKYVTPPMDSFEAAAFATHPALWQSAWDQVCDP